MLHMEPTTLAQQGMQRALDHAEADIPSWGETAFQFLKTYALQNPHFTGYMLVMASELDKSFPTPPTAKAWGGIFRGAVAAGLIENSGKTMPHPKRHACPAIVWRSKVYE